MDFSLSEEQTLLRDTLGRFLQDRYDFDARRKVVDSEAGWSPEVWRGFAEELGILGASFSEEHGGLGGGAVENMIVMEALGANLVVEPYLGTVVLGGGALKAAGGPLAEELIPAIVGGEAVFAFAYAEPKGRYDLADLETTARRDGDGWRIDGRKGVVVGAPWATHLLVTARTAGGRRDREGVSLFVVDATAPGISRRDYPTIDGRRASEIAFEGAPARLLGEADAALPLVEQVVDEGIAAVCAEAVGAMRRMHAMTVDYARQRKQFGRAIADFQVLQHRMVDMFMALEQSVSMTYLATLKLDAPAAERMTAASAAKTKIARSARAVGQDAVQIHGGIGMTDELALGHVFKRTTVIEGLFGDADHHLKRYERLTLGA
ncbi:MAG: acyl-CoA dehydrogenase family protein [Caulobacteraceae bacterium]|nr:acyl-CoA dehydrogenase family protein [Caulobacter sp.]